VLSRLRRSHRAEEPAGDEGVPGDLNAVEAVLAAVTAGDGDEAGGAPLVHGGRIVGEQAGAQQEERGSSVQRVRSDEGFGRATARSEVRATGPSPGPRPLPVGTCTFSHRAARSMMRTFHMHPELQHRPAHTSTSSSTEAAAATRASNEHKESNPASEARGKQP